MQTYIRAGQGHSPHFTNKPHLPQAKPSITTFRPNQPTSIMSLPGGLPAWMENNKEFIKNFQTPPHMTDIQKMNRGGNKGTIVCK